MYEQKDQSYFKLVRSDVVPMIPICNKLLDVGCGSGATSRLLKERGTCKEAHGIELFPEAANEAKKYLDAVHCLSIENSELPYSDNFFDVILCLDVLEHCADPWNVLRNLKRVLNKNGVLIASIPNISYTVVLLKILFNRFEYEDSGVLDRTHLRFFTLYTMKKMFEDSGYEIVRVEKNRAHGWKMYALSVLTLGIAWYYNVVQYKLIVKPK